MTLRLDKLLANLVGKEARIAHFRCDIFGGKTSDLKADIAEEIHAEYGQSFLNDADYCLFFKGGSAANDPEAVSKLFGIVDRALGKTANTLTKADVKKILNAEDGSVKYRFIKITLN